MRLFIAITLPKEVRDHLYDLGCQVDRNLAKVHWVAKKNLHLTLKFLGNVPNDDVKEVANALDDVSFTSFRLKLTKVGFYPGGFVINVVWVGVDNEEMVVELQKLVDSETLTFGDMKPGAHITLGRVKFVKDKKGLLDKVNNLEVKPLEFEVNSFTLLKSILTKDGPNYEVVKEYKLD